MIDGRPVVIIGSEGQLGWTLTQLLTGTRPLVPLGRADLDVTDDAAVDRVLRPLNPSVVVNCTAYNDVDGAEREPLVALDVNAFAVRAMARVATDLGAALVHYSTDFVFDGTGSAPARETDAPNPQSIYASSKLLGEWFALEAQGAYVFRVESLFGALNPGPRHSSLDTIVERMERGEEVPVFTDRTVSPSYVPDLAEATRAVLDTRPPAGLYHCVNSGMATWADVARETARLMGITPTLRLVTMTELALPASRPRFCALSNDKLAAAGIVMPTWQDAVRRFLLARRPESASPVH